jgi:hypothetical protein
MPAIIAPGRDKRTDERCGPPGEWTASSSSGSARLPAKRGIVEAKPDRREQLSRRVGASRSLSFRRVDLFEDGGDDGEGRGAERRAARVIAPLNCSIAVPLEE